MDKDDSDLPMSKTQLYCGNLPFSLTDDGLNALFTPYGELTDYFVAHRSQKPRGFGFVTFKNPSDAKKACAEINGRVVEGSREVNGAKEKREVRVMFARERPEGDRHHEKMRERMKSGKGGGKSTKNKKQEKPARKGKNGKGDNSSKKNVDDKKKNATNVSVAVQKTAPTKTGAAPKWGDIVKGKTKSKQATTTTSESKKQSSPKKKQQQQQQVSKEFAKLETLLKEFAKERWNSNDLYLRKGLTKSSGSLRDQIPKIASYIRAKKSLRRVNFSNNALDDSALKILCSGLADSNVSVVDLSANDISAEGAKYLASLLRKKNCALIELNLGYNRLNSEGIQHLAKALETNTSLKTLHVERNNLDNQASKAIGAILSQNKSLLRLNASRALFDKSEGYDQIANGLRANTTLQSIRLHRCKLGPDGARAIAAALKTNEKSSVVDIDVHFNKIGVLGAQEIGSMLAVNGKIKKLNLQYNNIGVEGASHIAKGLETNKTLNSLDISYNTIKDDGAKLIYKLIQNSEVLKSVNLEENFITQEGKAKLRTLGTDISV